MKYLDMLGPCIDKYGLITQTAQDNWDGGDTLQREGMFALGIRCLYDQNKITIADYLLYRQRYWDSLNELKCSLGNYKRHVDPTMWYSGSSVMSRDQWTPNIIAAGLLDLPDHRKSFFWGHLLKRAMLFMTNTRNNGAYPPSSPKYTASNPYTWKVPDLTVLSDWGYYIRAYKAYPLYPLLLVFDLEILANSLIWRYNWKYDTANTDILNHTNCLIQAQKVMPTPISWLARKLLSVDKVLATLTSYFTNDGPRIDLVFADFLKDLW